ncbi:Ku protein [Candidatus Palauibacter sp.]|uniref:non-homologous end joining protein Ku n=1 Tax=Candidatus Palauibacter sp. TaxID=3101350 RepID=UPI003B0160F5
MAPRSIASATISFGLVSIPCQLFSSAQNSQKVRFNFLSPDGARVKQQYVDAKTGEPVPRPDLVKGYQFAKDQYVTFTKEELKALEAEATQAIEIVEFVPLEQVERAYIGKTYYLGPGKGGDKAYRLLGAAMRKTGWAALAKYAARGKQYLVLVRPIGDHLVLEQLHYASEVRDIAAVPAGEGEVLDAELSLAVQLIEQIASDTFDPSKYEDEVGQRMLEAVERKVADGTEITAPVEEETTAQVIDLMAALRASVSKSGKSGSEEAGPEASDEASAASKRKSATG